MTYRDAGREMDAERRALLAERAALEVEITAIDHRLHLLEPPPMAVRWDRWVLAGLVVLALGAAVAHAVIPRRTCGGPIDSTRTDAQSVRSAAVMYVSENPGGDCPKMEDLTVGGYLDSNRRTTDVWDHSFRVGCQGDDVVVVSAGPDGRFDTEDDIQ